MSYLIRPMTANDLPLVRRWLSEPHVREWWQDVDNFEFVSGDIAHPDLAQFIVVSDETPFAYLQSYQLSDWDSGYGPQPEASRGIDQFIGEVAFLEGGHGSAFLRQFGDQLFQLGVPRLLVDPHPENLRAISAYKKAGFQAVREISTPDGTALMMERNP